MPSSGEPAAVDAQSDVVAFLRDPAAHDGQSVEVIETHVAQVFLVGDRAYKLKRAVKFPFLDFSTADDRKAACESEVRLNRRTAPRLYRGVTAVTRDAKGRLAIAGDGDPVDWLVEMNRFDQDCLFDHLSEAGALDDHLVSRLADAIAAFHGEAEPRPDKGGRDGLATVIDGNMDTLRRSSPALFKASELDRLERLWRGALDRVSALAEARREAGMVRWCHGDLHLRNICLLNGEPTLFDGIEFNPDIACVDVLYDLAFLLMDLQHRRRRDQANLVLNRYLARTEDYAGVALLPLFQSLRAGVRAMVSAIEALEGQANLKSEARDYLAQAFAFFEPPPPMLVAVGGLSGTGKSTLARAIAPLIGAAPGAVIVRSDMVRKHMFGVEPEDRLPPDAYKDSVSGDVYDRMATLARETLSGGGTVIVDAVFARPEQRDAMVALARRAGVPFAGLWLEAEQALLIKRVDERAARAADASDATAAVVEQQLGYQVGDIGWLRLDATADPAAVRQAALGAVEQRGAK